MSSSSYEISSWVLLPILYFTDINFKSNFTFQKRAFPSTAIERPVEKEPAAMAPVNPWEATSLTSLMRLTLMSLGGYHEILKDSSNKKSSVKYMTFPLPVDSIDSISSKTLHLMTAHEALSPKPDPHTSQATADLRKKNNSTQITVACVCFSKTDEVELLWTETCKTFSDIVNCEPLNSSRQAIFLMQTMQMAGRITQLPKAAWMKSLSEMLQRLPIDLKMAHERFSASDVVEICDLCLRCCNILFELFVSNFRQLLSSKEFGMQWLMFLGVLASNLKIANRGLPIFDETIEMMGALLRLLRPLPVAVDVDTVHANSSASVTTSASPLGNADVVDNVTSGSPEKVSLENFEEDSLLRESWRQILLVNPSIPQLLIAKHPKIVSDLTAISKKHAIKTQPKELSENSSKAEVDELSNESSVIKKAASGVFSVFGF